MPRVAPAPSENTSLLERNLTAPLEEETALGKFLWIAAASGSGLIMNIIQPMIGDAILKAADSALQTGLTTAQTAGVGALGGTVVTVPIMAYLMWRSLTNKDSENSWKYYAAVVVALSNVFTGPLAGAAILKAPLLEITVAAGIGASLTTLPAQLLVGYMAVKDSDLDWATIKDAAKKLITCPLPAVRSTPGYTSIN